MSGWLWFKRLARCPGLRGNGSLWNTRCLGWHPGLGVILRRWRGQVRRFAKVGGLHKRQNIQLLILLRHSDIVARPHTLIAKEECVDWFGPLLRSPRRDPLLIGAIENSLRRADR